MITFLIFSLIFAFAEESADVHVPEITVYGAPKASSLDFVPTVSELSGSRLQRKKQSTVGETLSRETGVTSSQFGPNASRPVIRGLEGERVRILQNGTGVLDASGASDDHAVAIDPLIVERFEVVRGPGALLYGNTAVGGVVNMVTNRIPETAAGSASGTVDSKFSSVDMGRSLGAAVQFPLASKWVGHFDGSLRGADDYRVPGFARTEEERLAEPLDPEEEGRVYNSFNRSSSHAYGTSYIFERGFVGTSVSFFNSNYGTVAERAVEIEMEQMRWDLSGEFRDLGFIKSLRLKNSLSKYQHDELEEGEVGTVFKNEGDEARVDAAHSLLGMNGVFGFQFNTFEFSAEGDEAFLPTTENRSYAVFIFEEGAGETFKPSFGARLENSEVKSLDHATFGAGQTKSFTGGSFSLGMLYQLNSQNAIVLNGAYTERAPNYEELFANGRHVATRQHERGNPELDKERSQSAELSWRHKGDTRSGSVGVFVQDFKDFIYLSPNGLDDGDPDEPFPFYDYSAINARLYGAEFEVRQQLPALLPGGTLEIELKGDMVRAINRDMRENLARITPIRETLGLIYKGNRFQADIEIQRSERQKKVAANDPYDTKTDAYTLVNLGAEIPFGAFSVTGRVNNVFDEEARNHVSILKDIAPLPGRNFVLGLTAAF